MKIAICDDEKKDAELLRRYIKKFNPDLEISAFSKGDSVLRAFDNDFYDIVFMDIDLDGTSGYDLAVELRRMEQPPLVIFVTQHVDYAIKGYGIAERYLTKPINYEVFSKALEDMLRKAEPERIVLTVQNKTYFLNVSEILYFEIFSHNIEFSQSNGKVIKIPITLKEVIDAFPKSNFVQIHRSYCVNMDHIDRIDGRNSVIMTNGKSLIISRSRYDDFSRKLHEYFNRSI